MKGSPPMRYLRLLVLLAVVGVVAMTPSPAKADHTVLARAQWQCFTRVNTLGQPTLDGYAQCFFKVWAFDPNTNIGWARVCLQWVNSWDNGDDTRCWRFYSEDRNSGTDIMDRERLVYTGGGQIMGRVYGKFRPVGGPANGVISAIKKTVWRYWYVGEEGVNEEPTMMSPSVITQTDGSHCGTGDWTCDPDELTTIGIKHTSQPNFIVEDGPNIEITCDSTKSNKYLDREQMSPTAWRFRIRYTEDGETRYGPWRRVETPAGEPVTFGNWIRHTDCRATFSVIH
jgi:hypothetical protein